MTSVLSVCMLYVSVSLTTRSTKNVPPMKRFLCPSWYGRLGNLMFQYASLYGIAIRNDMTLVVQDESEINIIFGNISAEKLQNDSVCVNVTLWGEQKPCSYDEFAANITLYETYIRHSSFLQSWKYFTSVEPEIRKQFAFREDITNVCQSIIDRAINKWRHKHNHDISNLQVIGVHIRREDYLDNESISFGYQVADENYLNQSMSYFREKYQNVVFLVYTTPTEEDIKWRQDHVTGNDVVLMKMYTPEVDMCALSKCNHSIITVGTFGWWSAWLANGTTIYFKDVARNDSKLRADFSSDMSDYFYPGWIGL